MKEAQAKYENNNYSSSSDGESDSEDEDGNLVMRDLEVPQFPCPEAASAKPTTENDLQLAVKNASSEEESGDGSSGEFHNNSESIGSTKCNQGNCDSHLDQQQRQTRSEEPEQNTEDVDPDPKCVGEAEQAKLLRCEVESGNGSSEEYHDNSESIASAKDNDDGIGGKNQGNCDPHLDQQQRQTRSKEPDPKFVDEVTQAEQAAAAADAESHQETAEAEEVQRAIQESEALLAKEDNIRQQIANTMPTGAGRHRGVAPPSWALDTAVLAAIVTEPMTTIDPEVLFGAAGDDGDNRLECDLCHIFGPSAQSCPSAWNDPPPNPKKTPLQLCSPLRRPSLPSENSQHKQKQMSMESGVAPAKADRDDDNAATHAEREESTEGVTTGLIVGGDDHQPPRVEQWTFQFEADGSTGGVIKGIVYNYPGFNGEPQPITTSFVARSQRTSPSQAADGAAVSYFWTMSGSRYELGQPAAVFKNALLARGIYNATDPLACLLSMAELPPVLSEDESEDDGNFDEEDLWVAPTAAGPFVSSTALDASNSHGGGVDAETHHATTGETASSRNECWYSLDGLKWDEVCQMKT